MTFSNIARGAIFTLTLVATGIVEWGTVGNLAEEQSCNVAGLVTTDNTFVADNAFLTNTAIAIFAAQLLLVPIYLIERAPALLRNTSMERLKKNFRLNHNLKKLSCGGVAGFIVLSSCVVLRYIGTVIRNHESGSFALQSIFGMSDDSAAYVAPFIAGGLFFNSIFFNIGVFLKSIVEFCIKPDWQRVLGVKYFFLGFFTASSLCFWLYRFIQHHGGDPTKHLAELVTLFISEFTVSLFMSGSVVPYLPKIISKLKQYPIAFCILGIDILAWSILNSWQSYHVSVNLFTGSAPKQYSNSTSLQDTCEFIVKNEMSDIVVHWVVTAITAIPATVATYLFALYQTKDLLGIKLEQADDDEEEKPLLPIGRAPRA